MTDAATAPAFAIVADDLSSDAVRDLVALHLAGMHEHSPPGHVFALDDSGLRRPDVTLFTAWTEDGRLAGMGALRDHPDGTAEIKSMRTAPAFLRQGVAAAILDHLIAAARRRGSRRISLETGSGPAFEPALALYRRRGFRDGEAFADYVRSEFNQFLHLDLEPTR